MIIYSKTGEKILDIEVDDTSYRYRAIRQGDKVYLYFSLTEHVEIPLYSYINYQGQRYTLWKPENLTKNGERKLDYVVEFGGYWEMLNRTKYKFLSGKPHKLKFPLTGTPRMFMQLLVDNLNMHDKGWALGTCIDAPEKTMAFDHENGMEVINRFADEWNTEFEFIGKTINFGKVERFKDNPLVLSYGKGNGFKTGVGRQNQGDKAPITILYVQGGERNINVSSYGSSTLLLPKDQELEYQDRRYKTDEDGMFITRADKELVNYNEDSYDASNIYPSRVGSVSDVIIVDAKKNFYDIKDASIPAALDYSQCRIAGEKATIIFQSGILTGKEFDLEQTDDALTGYIHSERRFKIVPQEIGGTIMPNDTFKPKIGDKYAIFNISLPDAYICDNVSKSGASWDMFREAVRYMYENEDENFTFKGELDGIWAKRRWLEIGGKLQPGGYVQFSDDQFQKEGILIRITAVKDYINKPHCPELELSNTSVAGFVSSELGKLEGDEVKDEERNNKALSFTKRRFRDAKEMQDMLEKAFLDFAVGVNPIWVQTMSLLVGEESLQFQFVDNKTAPKEVDHPFYYDNESKVFETPAGIIQHLTLGIDKLSSSLEPSDYKYWDISSYTSPPLTDQSPYYLYLVCKKEGTTGYFTLSKEAHRLDPGDGNYYFLTGTLGADVDNIRSFATLYGFTEIGPGWMRVKQIISPDGKTYFNVAMGEIGGKLVLKAGSSGLKELAEWTGVDKDITNAQKTANDAQKAADDANSEAEIITGVINDWASDSIISPMEKTGLRQQLSDIQAEYQEIAGQATRYSLTNTTAWSNYYSAYLSAVNALNKYTASSPSDIPVQSDYSNISAYYTRRKTILDAIAAAAKKYVDDLADSMGGASAGIQELAYLKEAIANETVDIGGLLLTSLLKLGIRSGSTWEEKAGINGTAKNSNDVIAWFGGTLNQAINNTASIVFKLDGSGQLAKGNIRWDKDGNVIFDGTVYGRNGEFSGNLDGVSGSFKSLNCINDRGQIVGQITFDGNSGRIWFNNGDIQHQGGKDGRSLRFLSSDIWCRGNFGARQRCTVVVYGSYAYYYTDVLGGSKKVYKSLQLATSSGDVTYYDLPLYCSDGEGSGMPVDLVIFNVSSGTYRYNMIDSFDNVTQVNITPISKIIKVVNGNDKMSVYIYANGYLQELAGGCVADYTNIAGFMIPTVPADRLGRGWLRNGIENNDWS